MSRKVGIFRCLVRSCLSGSVPCNIYEIPLIYVARMSLTVCSDKMLGRVWAWDELSFSRPGTNNVSMPILTLILSQKLCTTQQDRNNTNTDSFAPSYQQIEHGFLQTFVTTYSYEDSKNLQLGLCAVTVFLAMRKPWSRGRMTGPVSQPLVAPPPTAKGGITGRWTIDCSERKCSCMDATNAKRASATRESLFPSLSSALIRR